MRFSLLICVFSSTLLFGASEELQRAEKLFRHTDYSAAAAMLGDAPHSDPAVNELLGRSYLMLGDYKKATDYLEKAVALEPGNSSYHAWLGKVYGRRAETSFATNALGWASKSRNSFEKAVALDEKNYDAVGDLFEYYLEAPGFLGGGLDKAEKLAQIVAHHDPAEGAYDLARIAEARKQFDTAEAHLKRAADLAPQQVGRLLDLAKFLAKRGRFEESDSAFGRAEKVAPGAPKVMFAEASTYIKTNRNVDTARELLKKYLNASITSDDPPKYEAEKLLRKVSTL